MKIYLPFISRVITALFIMVLLGLSPVYCQQGNEALSADYSRPSVSFFITSYAGDGTSMNAAASAEKIYFSDKYFNHNLSSVSFEMPGDFKNRSYDDKRALLKEYLERNGIGREMVAKWFSRQENGMFSLNYIHKCGMYDANDQDVLMSEAAKRGEAVMKDAGQNLVNKTYVLIISPKEFTSFDDKTSHGWRSRYDVFLYKLDFDYEVVERFYKIWPYDDDPEEVKNVKIAAFDTLSFSFTYVYGKSDLTSGASELYVLTDNPKSSAQLFDEMVIEIYNNAVFNINKDLEAFRVKVNVSGTHPIRSKIGKKEGLRCDQRYFVYEFVWDEKTDTAKEDRKAVVRATGKIADNREVATGYSPESKFYQIYGGTVKQGMVMQQRNDLGISLVAGYGYGGFGGIAGFEAGLWIRTGFFTNIPSLYAMVDIGFDMGDYAPVDLEDKDYSFFRYSAGLGKGIRFARIVELIPFLAWGQESTSNDSLSVIRTNYMKGGGVLGINITHNFSVMGQFNYYAPYGSVSTEIRDSENEAIKEEYEWTDKFAGRDGISLMFGIRFEF